MHGNASTSGSPFTRALFALYGVGFCSGMAMGIFSLLTSTWMEEAGFPTLTIGLVSACYYLFQIVGAPFAERMVHARGVRATIVVGLFLTAVASPLFPLTRAPLGLAAVRAASGLGVGICVIAAQTGLVATSRRDKRAIVSGIHALAFAVGLALGPIAGPGLYGRAPMLAALFGSVVVLAGLVVTWLAAPDCVIERPHGRSPVATKITLPLHAIFAYGFAEATLFSLFPAALMGRGFSVGEMGITFSTFVVGSILFTLPITHAADRFGRRPVLVVTAVVATAAVLVLPFVDGVLANVLVALVAGGSVGPLYALAMALVGDPLGERELPSGMAAFTIALGLGCVVGPPVSAVVVSTLGGSTLFVPTAALLGLLVPHAAAIARRGSGTRMGRVAP